MSETAELPDQELFAFSLQREKLHEQIAERIQQLIACDSLRPGAKLPGERELAERLGVSRTVVREAIRVLNVKGLVKVKPGCGSYVQALSPKDAAASMELFLKLQQASRSLQHIHEVRSMIELEAASLAAVRATGQDCAAIQAAVEDMEMARDCPERYVRSDLAFHAAIAAATHNDLFTVLLSPIADLMAKVIQVAFQVPGAAEDGLAAHRDILAQIRARDPDRAKEAMRCHLDHVKALVEGIGKQAQEEIEEIN